MSQDRPLQKPYGLVLKTLWLERWEDIKESKFIHLEKNPNNAFQNKSVKYLGIYRWIHNLEGTCQHQM